MTEPNPTEIALAALARKVEALHRALEDMAALPGQVADLAGIVATLRERSPGGTPPHSSGLHSWLDQPADFAEAVALLVELGAWLRTVYLRYPDGASGLPECWLWHPDVVEELLWLRTAWVEAYGSESAARAADWHDRLRPGVVRRVRAVAGTCSLEAHQPRGERHRAADLVPLADAIHMIGDWWTTNRASIAPAPDGTHIAAAAALRELRRRV